MLTLTLTELSQILNDLVDAGHGDRMVYCRDSLLTSDEIKLETIAGVDFVGIGDLT